MGNLESIQLSEASGFHMHTVHKFPNTKRPVPHVEQPVTATKDTTYSVSFLGPQTITAAQTSFDAQPHYTFESRSDFERFQETVFDQQLLFIAGVSEIKSKGRGEECISQNLRLLRAKNGRQTLLYFANSQKKEKKRYVSLPLDSIDRMNQAPKPGKPATLRLRPNTDQLTQLKTVYITFLDDIDQKTFWALLCAGVGSAS
ncbi:MAG: hypothetical protein M1819_002151 [Sarea resinae]|nr:MAG: hypothetical protein M1819_002151 [Sarea resinae]